MTATDWGCKPEHAVEAVQFLTEKFGHAPNYNMLALAISLPKGVLNMGAIDRALKAGLIREVDKLPDGRSGAFGGCRTVFVLAEGVAT